MQLIDDWRSYFYTAQGNSGEIETVHDQKNFLETLAALDLLHISTDVQKSILRFFAGLLLFGNVRFSNGPDEYTEIDVSSRPIALLKRLMHFHLCIRWIP